MNCLDFREEFCDDDHRRFHVFILRFPTLNIALVEHILGLIFDPASDAQGREVPTGPGTWVLGVDGDWYRVNQAELNLIDQIEVTRMVDRHGPIVIGGGISLHTAASQGVDPSALLPVVIGGLALIFIIKSL